MVLISLAGLAPANASASESNAGDSTFCKLSNTANLALPGECENPDEFEAPTFCEAIDIVGASVPGQCGQPIIPETPDTCESLAEVEIAVPGLCGAPLIPQVPNVCDVIDAAEIAVPGLCGAPLIPTIPKYCDALSEAEIQIPGQCGNPLIPEAPDTCETLDSIDVALPGVCGAPIIPTIPKYCEKFEEYELAVPGQCGQPLIPSTPGYCEIADEIGLKIPGQCGNPIIPEPPEDCEAVLAMLPGALPNGPDPCNQVPSEPMDCEAQRSNSLLAIHFAYRAVCQAANAILGNCEKEGDCECGTQKQIIKLYQDTDEDGVRDEDDPDDDCDRLSDKLEDAVGLPPLRAGNVYDLMPFSHTTDEAKIGLGIQAFSFPEWVNCVYEYHIGGCYTVDPYLLAQFTYVGEDTDKMELVVPDFNELDHPVDKRSHEFSTKAWGTFVEATIPRDYLSYVWVEGATGFPKVQYTFELMDADGFGRGADDRMGETQSVDYTLLQLAGGVRDSKQDIGDPKTLPRSLEVTFADRDPRVGGSDAPALTLDLKVGTTINPCALRWASLYSSGVPFVDLPEINTSEC